MELSDSSKWAKEVLARLKISTLRNHACLALHSAAEFHRCKNTNLQTVEIYILNPEQRIQLEQELELQPQERGYEVLLIKPYYKAMLTSSTGKKLRTSEKLSAPHSNLLVSPALLAFLDLYNFPLRGKEQAEFMAQRIPKLKRIFKMD